MGNVRMIGLRFRTIRHVTPDGDLVWAVQAYTGANRPPDGWVGQVTIKEDASVGDVHVLSSYRRRGLATQLYERAAQIACTKIGNPLHSDVERSGYAQAFWEKQERKGRARCLSRTAPKTADMDTVIVGRGGCVRYALSCPAPTSLAGRKRRP
jgi:GNAT superfamily N-acetyltransferase